MRIEITTAAAVVKKKGRGRRGRRRSSREHWLLMVGGLFARSPLFPTYFGGWLFFIAYQRRYLRYLEYLHVRGEEYLNSPLA